LYARPLNPSPAQSLPISRHHSRSLKFLRGAIVPNARDNCQRLAASGKAVIKWNGVPVGRAKPLAHNTLAAEATSRSRPRTFSCFDSARGLDLIDFFSAPALGCTLLLEGAFDFRFVCRQP
jgi:hypothetical protein